MSTPSSADTVHAVILILHCDCPCIAALKSLATCNTLCDRVCLCDSSAPGSDLVHAPPPVPFLAEEGTQIHNPGHMC